MTVMIYDFKNEVSAKVEVSKCLESVSAEGDYIELENGTWIKSTRDGRFFDEQGNAYGEAFDLIEYDEEGEVIFVNFINKYYRL